MFAPTPRHALIRRWLALLAWMALIFVASSDTESGPRGSRLLAPLIRWLHPDIAPATLDLLILTARKGVHFVTFGILAGLAYRALGAGHPGAWRGSTGLRALVLTVAYAISDEIHQSFVPTRVGSAIDVLIDSAGALAVLAAIRGFGLRRASRR